MKESDIIELLETLKHFYVDELKKKGKIVATPKDFKKVFYPNRRFFSLGYYVKIKVTDLKVSLKQRPGLNPFYEFTNYVKDDDVVDDKDIKEIIKPNWKRVKLGVSESSMSLYQKIFKTNLLYIDENEQDFNAYYEPTIRDSVSSKVFDRIGALYE